MVCGFERFTEDQGVLVAKTSPAKVVQFEYHIKVELSTLITWVLSVTSNYETVISFKKIFCWSQQKLKNGVFDEFLFPRGTYPWHFKMIERLDRKIYHGL